VLLIGIDVGTTAVKAALFDARGRSQKSFSRRYETSRPAPAHVEQRAEDWWTLVERALHELSEGVPAGAVRAVGLTSQVNTHVFVDEGGTGLAPAMTWQDGRCAAMAAKLDARVPLEAKLDWWGAPLPIDASHVLARIAYVAEHQPEVWRKTRWVMAPKDYCLLKLTGDVATDPMTAFGVVDGQLQLIEPLLDLVPGAGQRLPPRLGFTEVMGTIREGLAFAGTPVVTGTMDAWAGLLGSGVSLDGEAVYLSGTSEILGIVSKNRAPTPGVIAFPECEGIVLHAGPTQSGGASIEWLSRLLGRSPDELSVLAGEADMAGPVPLFLPHLEGERAPLWDSASRGSLSHLSSSMGAAEVTRAVLEGVAYSARWLLESLETSACLKPAILNHSGGGSRSDLWCQIRADVLGRPLRRTALRDAGILGAALLAGVGCGMFPSIAGAAKAFVAFDREFQPRHQEAARHDQRFEQYRELYAGLKYLRDA
jgi:xylulokinase